MADRTGIDLPASFKPGNPGDRYLSVIPVAQGAIIGDVLVILVAIERCTSVALLNVRVALLQGIDTTQPREQSLWPRLQFTGIDDIGTTYRIDGGNGIGSGSDFQMEFGMMPAIVDQARQLDITLTEVAWEDMDTRSIQNTTSGSWTFSIDLTGQRDARMI